MIWYTILLAFITALGCYIVGDILAHFILKWYRIYKYFKRDEDEHL